MVVSCHLRRLRLLGGVRPFLRLHLLLCRPCLQRGLLVNVVVPIGSTVSIDDVPIDEASYTNIGSGGYRLAQQEVEPGVHSVTGDAAFGLTTYGYACDVSYAYPGGLKLQSIAQP